MQEPWAQDEAAGFTLLEILVALVIFGFILVGLSGGLRFGIRAWETQSRVGAQSGDLDAIDLALRSLVAVAEPADIRGDSGRLALITALPVFAQGQLADVVLLASGNRLVLSWRRHSPGRLFGPALTLTNTEITDGVAEAAFAYLPRNGMDGWQSVWDRADPPALIRLRLRFNDGRHWPDLVLAPMRIRMH